MSDGLHGLVYSRVLSGYDLGGQSLESANVPEVVPADGALVEGGGRPGMRRCGCQFKCDLRETGVARTKG